MAPIPPPPGPPVTAQEAASTASKTPRPNITSVTAATNGGAGDPSLVRVFGLKLGRVVIDPGHGGKDTGTIGPNGLAEKDLVLDVATRLGKLITQKLNAEVVFTREGDTFIPLEERTEIANREKADLFISVHANASSESSVTGVETYYFNLNSDRKGLELAMRENATSGASISDLSDLLHRAVLQTKLEESREFAQKVQDSLCANSIKMNARARNRGVRQAPFVVLIGATMPSILAEVGFVSNPRDERLMKRGEQRQKIADALFKGVMQYAASLSHVQIAQAGTN
jgi:N-acetylmuramoyl-L-alanine amidase